MNENTDEIYDSLQDKQDVDISSLQSESEEVPQSEDASESESLSVLEETPQQEEIPEPEIRLTISKDNMTAYLSVIINQAEQTIPSERIFSVLESQKIVYGIKTEEIEEFCEKKTYFKELICAQGDLAEDEENGEIIFHFQTDVKACPKVLDNGMVDYHNLGIMQEVKAGDLLCSLELPKGGKDGINIYGIEVKRKPGITPKLPQGNNTAISEDGFSLVARVDGCVCYKGGLVIVEDVYIVKGDVDHSTGNIDFSGSVIIYGDVRTGFQVTSGKDISVRGVVEGAKLKAEGNIVISSGMIGMGSGHFEAGGNVTARYFENASGTCGNDIFADFYVNSRITAGRNIVTRGQRSTILGGQYKAEKAIYAGSIGTDTNVSTTLEIMNSELLAAISGAKNPKIKELSNKIDTLKKDQAEVEKKTRQYQLSQQVDFTALKKMMVYKSRIEKQLKHYEAELEEIDTKNILNDYKIVVKQIVYPGTKIIIGSYVHTVLQPENHMKYLADESNIVLADVLPSDSIERV